MTRKLLMVVLLATASSAAMAEGGGGPVCRRDTVLDRLRTLLSQAGRPMVLDARTVGERSAGAGRIVSCAVQGHRLGYETSRDGIQPIDTPIVVHYALELRQNGIFLRLE